MRKFIVFILIVIPSNLAFAQQSKQVTLKEFMELMVREDPEIKSILNTVNQTKYIRSLDLPSNNLVLSNSTQFGLNTEEGDNSNAITTALSKPFLSIGADLELKHTMTETTDREEQITSLKYSQQILNNTFGSDYKLQSEAAALESKIIELQATELYETRISSLINVYFDYQLALLRLKTVRNQLDDAEKLHKLVLNKARNAIASDIDVARSDLQYLLSKAELESTEEQFENYRNLVLNLTDTNYSPMANLKDLNTVKISQLLKTSHKIAADRELEILDLQIEKADTSATLTKRATSPDLSIFLGGQKDNSTRFQSETQKTEFLVGMELTMAIGEDSSKQAAYQRALYEQTQLGLKRALQTAQKKDQITQASEKIKRQISLMDLADKRLKNAKKIVSGEEVRHRSGRIDLEKLISARDLEKEAELYFLNQNIALRKALVSWLAATDQLVENGSLTKLWSYLD